jgi:hypothetical protein
MAPKHHPLPLSGGDRKALAKELGRARAMTTILATRSGEARIKGEALIRTADQLLCESWNERMWADGEPIDPSPTVDRAINGGYRPDFEPPCIGRPYVMAITLNRLGEREVDAMIDRVTPDRSRAWFDRCSPRTGHQLRSVFCDDRSAESVVDAGATDNASRPATTNGHASVKARPTPKRSHDRGLHCQTAALAGPIITTARAVLRVQTCSRDRINDHRHQDSMSSCPWN